MKSFYHLSQTMRYIFLFIALAIVIISILFTNSLAKKISAEEHNKIEIWAEATRQFIRADENTDIDFVSSIMEGNNTIPVYMVDDKDHLLFSRNVKEPNKNVAQFYVKEIERLKKTQTPIEVRIDDQLVQYIYYDDSILLKQLQYFPYIQFGVIFIFIFIAFMAFAGTQKAEQKRVWVGLSKETAHQLGTPISSLLAWTELLTNKYPDDKLLPEMGKDVNRLRIIAERFSKIGSKPDLTQENIIPVIENAVAYMQSRSSNKVAFAIHSPQEELFAGLNIPLFEWVIENLCKNAIDAMDGTGNITFDIVPSDKKIIIDITDSGKGIERSKFKTIFKPGFTTKKRGWGLGLSLTKRIVEEYHRGRIYVKQSEIGHGTTFRIMLKRFSI